MLAFYFNFQAIQSAAIENNVAYLLLEDHVLERQELLGLINTLMASGEVSVESIPKIFQFNSQGQTCLHYTGRFSSG